MEMLVSAQSRILQGVRVVVEGENLADKTSEAAQWLRVQLFNATFA